ncbi:MAG: phosphodiester glycosidase family protein [Sulfitobacter sp.]
MKRLAALGLFLLAATAAHSTECRKDSFAGNSYTICDVDLTQERLELFLTDDTGTVYGHFGTLDAALKAKGAKLGFATNAGMYHEDRSPVGHYVENGTEYQSVIPNAGPGNFGLLPNGVLCLREGRADVFETTVFLATAPDCRSATQSGPMLVIDGKLHPRFLINSTSRFIRNGVGSSDDGTQATFVISDTVVTFHEFGTLFRDHLKLRNALYFDGNISRMRAPELGRSGLGFTSLGPIIGVIESAQ